MQEYTNFQYHMSLFKIIKKNYLRISISYNIILLCCHRLLGRQNIEYH